MSSLSINVTTDDRELRAKLRRIERRLPGTLTAACIKGADIVADAARAKAPRGATGNLAAGVAVRPAKRGAWVRVDAVADDDREYAGHVEYGTSRMPARPFLRPAVDGNRSKVLRTIADALHDALVKP